jgi:hypothetical protein
MIANMVNFKWKIEGNIRLQDDKAILVKSLSFDLSILLGKSLDASSFCGKCLAASTFSKNQLQSNAAVLKVMSNSQKTEKNKLDLNSKTNS